MKLGIGLGLGHARRFADVVLAGTWDGYLDADYGVSLSGSDVTAVSSLDGAIGAVAGAAGPTLDENWLGSGRRAFQFNGSTQFLTANAFAALVSGEDAPFAIAWHCSLNNINTQQDCWGLGHSSGAGSHEFRNNSSAVTRSIRTPDSGSAHLGSSGGAFPSTETVATLSFDGANLVITYDGSTVASFTQNVTTCTFDRFAIGALLKATASQFMAGRIRRIAYRTTPFSAGDITALQGWFGT